MPVAYHARGEVVTTATVAASHHLIKRPRLTRLLDESDARIITLVAPAGYGKTTLAREWLEDGDRPYVWYSARPASADVAALAADLATALRPLPPVAGKKIADLLQGGSDIQRLAPKLAAALSEAIAAGPPDAVVVIDDYHLLATSDGAENFITSLIDQSPCRFLITSRHRPRWATARLRLYGALLEIDTADLSMTTSEADLLLSSSHTDPHVKATMHRTSQGWPAVLGLAYFAKTARLPTLPLADALYEYFADELYHALDSRLKQQVRILSYPVRITPTVLRYLFGSESHRIVATATEAGFLSKVGREPIMHPLLRQFLNRKIMEEDSSSPDLERFVRFLISDRSYDDAFAVISVFRLDALLPELLADSLDRLLSSNRYPTLETWLAHARQYDVEAPVLDIVAAELALRRGVFHTSATLASKAAASALGTDDGLAARALLVLGRAEFFKSEEDTAANHLAVALQLSEDEAVSSEILWTSFLVAAERRTDEAERLLAMYAQSAAATYDGHVRVLTGRGILAARRGGIARALIRPHQLRDIAERTGDPMIRSSLVTTYAHLLVMAGRYEDAWTALLAQFDEAGQGLLDFALPYMLILRAAADTGRRRYSAAAATLDELRDSASGDPYLAVAAASQRGRLLVVQGHAAEAVAALGSEVVPPPNKSLYAEYLAIRAVAMAALGRAAEARALLERVSALTHAAEACCLCHAAELVMASQSADAQPRLLRDQVAAIIRLGCLDALVLAYRSAPDLIRALGSLESCRASFQSLLVSAHDVPLARRHGLALPPHLDSFSALTKREHQVLSLVADGLSNKEIAGHLYITEVTAKRHVHHILAKLGARTRTEAALAFAERA